MNVKILAGLALVVLAGSSCTGPGAPSERKRLPGYGNAISPEMGRKKLPGVSEEQFSNGCFAEMATPFADNARPAGLSYTNSEEIINGTLHSCISFHLPDASMDEKLISLVSDYKSLAMPMLAQWSRQSRNGVVIDFRKSETEQYSTEAFELSGPGFSFPVMVKWDRNSGMRYANLVNLAKDFTGISLKSEGSEYFF